MALDFDAGDKVSIGSVNPLAGASAGSWVMWQYFDDVTDTEQYWFGRDFGTADTLGIATRPFLRIDGTGGSFIRRTTIATSTLFTVGQWAHVAWTWDYNGGSPLFGYYVDGVSQPTVYFALSDVVSAIGTGTGDYNFGDTNLGAANDWAGGMDHVQLVTRALSEEEVAELRWKPGSIVDSCVGYWPFYSTNPPDLSGQGNDGTGSGVALTDGPPVHFPTNF